MTIEECILFIKNNFLNKSKGLRILHEKNGQELQNRKKENNLKKYGKESTNQVETIILKQKETRKRNGTQSKDFDDFVSFKIYENIVRKLTEVSYKIYKKIINPTNIQRNHFLNHLDHKLSVMDSYNNKIHPFLVCHYCNLEIISYKENKTKAFKSNISVFALLDKIYKIDILDFNTFFNFYKLYNYPVLSKKIIQSFSKNLLKNNWSFYESKKNN